MSVSLKTSGTSPQITVVIETAAMGELGGSLVGAG
jgi:hypothetical protein